MKRQALILGIVFILLSSIAIADVGNLQTWYNSFTSQFDYVSSLNQTGYNITADYFFGDGSHLTGISTSSGFTNGSDIEVRIINVSNWINVSEVYIEGNKVINLTEDNVNFYSNHGDFIFYSPVDNELMRITYNGSPSNVYFNNATLNIGNGRLNAFTNPILLELKNITNITGYFKREVWAEILLDSVYSNGTRDWKTRWRYLHLNDTGGFSYDYGVSGIKNFTIYVTDGLFLGLLNVSYGDYLNISYIDVNDIDQNITVYLPIHENVSTINDLFVTGVGSTFYDIELTELAQAGEIDYKFYIEGNAVVSNNLTTDKLCLDSSCIDDWDDVNMTDFPLDVHMGNDSVYINFSTLDVAGLGSIPMIIGNSNVFGLPITGWGGSITMIDYKNIDSVTLALSSSSPGGDTIDLEYVPSIDTLLIGGNIHFYDIDDDIYYNITYVNSINSSEYCIDKDCITSWSDVNVSGGSFTNNSDISVNYLNASEINLSGDTITSWDDINQSWYYPNATADTLITGNATSTLSTAYANDTYEHVTLRAEIDSNASQFYPNATIDNLIIGNRTFLNNSGYVNFTQVSTNIINSTDKGLIIQSKGNITFILGAS